MHIIFHCNYRVFLVVSMDFSTIIYNHNVNISFSGCGFLGIYHIGVASCLKTYAPYLLENKICGSSAGAISACCLLCDIPLGKFFKMFVNYIFYFS